MPRKVPAPPSWHAPPGGKTITVQLRLITPMFGGGYEPRHVDTDNPIRAASIRGHLRFWWRALYGGQYCTPQALFAAEEDLWGSMEKPGKVAIAVFNVACPSPVVEKSLQNRAKYKGLATLLKPQWPRYALHPFQGQLQKGGTAIDHEPERAIETGSFALRLVCRGCPAEEVVGTMKAWVKYGGVGARTRRGCGSIELVSGDDLASPRAAMRPGGSPITCISGTRFVLGPETDNPVEAWKTAVEAYAEFRQMRYGNGPRRPGRSKWPEPDTIRRIEGRQNYPHPPRHPVQRGFPRADLGLPIVFHFKDQADPEESILQPRREGATRLASPVITKAVATGNGRYRPIIAVLHAPHAWEFGALDISGTQVRREWIELSASDRNNCEPLSGQDARAAVLEHARQKWGNPIKVKP